MELLLSPCRQTRVVIFYPGWVQCSNSCLLCRYVDYGPGLCHIFALLTTFRAGHWGLATFASAKGFLKNKPTQPSAFFGYDWSGYGFLYGVYYSYWYFGWCDFCVFSECMFVHLVMTMERLFTNGAGNPWLWVFRPLVWKPAAVDGVLFSARITCISDVRFRDVSNS